MSRILLVSHELSVTGAPNSLLRQAKYFLSAGHEVRVWTLRDGALRARYEAAGIVPEPVADARLAIKAKYESEGVRYDLVVCNTIRTYRAADVLRRTGTPVAWFVRETQILDEDHWLNPDFARVFDGFDNLYAVSDYCADVVRRYNPNVRVLRNAVADDCRSAPSCERLRFGYIGSYIEWKGIGVLLEAFREVRRRFPDAELVLAGKVWLPFGLELKARHGGDPGLVWLGEVQGEAKQTFFDSIGVLCVPSLDEPSGLTVLEGAMHGKAVVTTDRTGANYVVSADSGRIVRAGSVEDLSQALAELAGRGVDTLAEMGRRSRENYLRLGTPERERTEVLALLEENRGRVPTVRGRMRQDNPLFHETRYLDGRRRFYVGGLRLFTLKGAGPRRRDA